MWDLNHQVKFTYGGSIEHPAQEKIVSANILVNENKWSRFPVSGERKVLDTPRLSDFFLVKRGIATGDNKYFILTKRDLESKGLPISQFKPILPSPRHLSGIEVGTDDLGYPSIEDKLFVLDCKLAISEVEQLYPELYTYLQVGIKTGVADRYLCKSRKLWYAQENRADSRFYCTDMQGKRTRFLTISTIYEVTMFKALSTVLR